MPLFAFVVLSVAFSHPVIRGLGVVVVDGDRSEISRAFVEQVAASPNLSIVERSGDLASAARAIRAGDAIAAVYIPANFERDLKAERRPQVVAFYNQQFLTAAGVASSGLSDSLAAASQERRRSVQRRRRRASGRSSPKRSRWSIRGRNYAQFLLRTLLPMVPTSSSRSRAAIRSAPSSDGAACATGSQCAGGNPIVALAGKLRRCSRSFFSSCCPCL